MSFIELKTSRAFDIVKPSKKSRNLVDPAGEGRRMNADEARREGWEEAALVAETFDAIDGLIPNERSGVELLSIISKRLT